MQQQSSGLTDLAFGESWLSATWRTLAVFVGAYLLPAFLLAGNRLGSFVQLVATVVCFAGASLAIYRFLQQRESEQGEWEQQAPMPLMDATVFVDDEPPPRITRSAPKPAATAASPESASIANTPASAVAEPAAAPAARAELPVNLNQAALERFCIALYRFNGLRSDMVATGVPGAYRIRLFPRNADKPIALLLCESDDAVQGQSRYESFLRDMRDAEVEKGFFVAPAGFTPEVVAVARAQHVTLVDDKLLRAMLDRLPDGARSEAIAAAGGVVP